MDRLREWTEAHYGRLLAGIVVLAAVLRILVHFDLKATDPAFDIPALDSRVFLHLAGKIAAGDWIGDHVFFLNPLYPYFIAPLVRLFPGGPLGPIRIVQGLMGLGTVLFVAGAARRLLGRPAALGAALLAGAYPFLLFYEEVAMIVTLATFLNAATLWLLARLADGRRLRDAFLAGLALGLSVLARPNVGLFAVFLPLWLLALGPRGARLRFAAARTALLVAGGAAVVLPVTIRNYAVGHDLVLVTSSMGVNLWQANGPEAVASGQMSSSLLRPNPILVETDAISIAERDEGRSLSPSEVSAYWSHRTLAQMAAHPGAAAGFFAKKLLMFLRGFEIPSSYHFEAERDGTRFLRLIPLSFGLLCPLALVGMFTAFRRRIRAGLYVLLFTAYAIGLTIFYPLGHYRAPMLPAVFPLTVLGLSGLARAARAACRRDFRTAGAGAGVLLVALLPALLSPIGRVLGIPSLLSARDNRLVWNYKRGDLYLERGDVEEAERWFRAAADSDPGSILPEVGFAAVARARGDLATEFHHLERAVRLDPRDETLRALVGRNLFDRGNRKQGLALVETAAAALPRDWKIRAFLGGMYAAEGRFEDALTAYLAAEKNGCPGVWVIGDQSRCLRTLGRYGEAMRRVEAGLRIEPASGVLHLERALIRVESGSPDVEAIREDARRARDAGLALPPELRRFAR